MHLRLAPIVLAFAVIGPFPLFTTMAQTDSKQTPSKPRLGSTVFKWEDLPVKPTPLGERRDVANNPTATLDVFECHITTLNPGKASHPPHRHAQEELIVVKEGLLEVHINGQTQRAGAGSVFFYASNDAHAVTNVGDQRATYWVINLATAATHDPAKHNKTPTRPSGVFDWEKFQVQPTKVGERRDVLKGSTVTMENLSYHITTVNAHEASHAAHRHPDEELILVKEGMMEVTINGQSQRAGPGSIFLFAPNDLHGMRNVGDTRATYHVIRVVTAATQKTPPAAGK
jgi:quercetin dioxygenase-like cupin family protein